MRETVPKNITINLLKTTDKEKILGLPCGPVVKISSPSAGHTGSIHGKTLHTSWPKIKTCIAKKFNKDFKNGPPKKKKKERERKF